MGPHTGAPARAFLEQKSSSRSTGSLPAQLFGDVQEGLAAPPQM